MVDLADRLKTNGRSYSSHADDDSFLSDAHKRQLRDSAVGDDVARERGYRTETVKARLKSLRLPGLAGMLIPIWDVRAEQTRYQLKPDEPRTDKRGKLIKYESPAGSSPLLDVHPRLSRRRSVEQLHPDHPSKLPPLIADPRVPLIITEGSKKADSGVTIDLCCVSLLGVFSFRGKNQVGGVVALPDWESVALKRDVFICFDSDVMCKQEVHQALDRLGRFLSSRGANVFYIYLSAGPNGEKTGLDDYIVARLAEGLSHEQVRNLLLSQGTAELRKHPSAAKSTTDADLIEAAIRRAEAEATAPIRAQYRDENGRLIHAVPLKEKLLLLKSGDAPDAELIEEPEVLPTRSSMSPDGQRRYMVGSRIDLHTLLSRLHEFIKARLICRYPWQARLLALWIFGTYMHCLFEYYGYIHVTGPSMRAGKSVTLEIISATSFNAGPVTADPTPAIIYRDANRNCGTQIYDELEGLREGDKEKWAAVISILNVGFKRGATIPRILDPQADTMREFCVYSPKAFASIKSLNDTTADRSFRIELLRKKPKEKTLSVGNAAALAAAAALRDDCHLAALEHAEIISGVYAEVAGRLWPEVAPDNAVGLPSPDTDSRARDILTPLFAIAITADHGCGMPQWYTAMLDATAAIAGTRGDTGNDELNLIAAAIALKDHCPGRDTFAITSDQAFALFKGSEELGWLEGDGGAKALLRKLGLHSAMHRRERFTDLLDSKPTVRGYLVKRADLDDIIARYQPSMNPEEAV